VIAVSRPKLCQSPPFLRELNEILCKH
jgi:hypothetical protein